MAHPLTITILKRKWYVVTKRERRKLDIEYISPENLQSNYGITPDEFKKEQEYYDPGLDNWPDDDSDEKRDVTLSVRVTHSDEFFLDRKANELGLTKSDILRLLVRKAKDTDKVI